MPVGSFAFRRRERPGEESRMTEPRWDLATEEGLREACAELEGRIDPERLAQVTQFLEEVAAVPPHERASEEFQRRIWSNDLIVRTSEGTYDWLPEEALGNLQHRRWFADRTNAELPTDWQKRGEALADVFWETANRFILSTGRPRRRTLATLAALFPEHLAGAVAKGRLDALQSHMGSSPLWAGGLEGAERVCRDQVLYSYWIRHRLDEVLGRPKTMEGHARRLLLSGELADLVSRDPKKRKGPTNVWLFRAGSKGEDEEAWLDRGLAFLGFHEVGALTECKGQDDVRKRVTEARGVDAKSVTSTATQLRQFAVDARLGDLVVMPRKGHSTVAIGRITGPYEHADVDGVRRHTREVEWVHTDLPKDWLGPDLNRSLHFVGTVCGLGGEHEVGEIERLLLSGPPEPVADRPCWFVGATFGAEDQTDRFLRDGVWENGYDDEYLDQVRSIEPGDRIAIKSTYTRKHGLPFDNRAKTISTMAIKATGVVTENVGDGRNLRVRWRPVEPHREWYFYTYLKTLWEVTSDSGVLQWAANALIDFTFNGTEQDYDRFLRHWFPEWYVNGPVPPPMDPEVPPLGEIVECVQASASKRGLAFDPELIESLHLGLWANPQRHFAILAGLSGSGKTQLAMEYGRALTGADDESSVRLCAVSAAPGWHDPSPLLGYVNPLDGKYAGTDFQRFLLNAAGNPKEVHICVLDEMNLSHPEQYLAPLLSAMEREGGMVEFHDADEMALGVPPRIHYPRNLVLIGTVNMDETTMGISDKVLDRAFTLEFWDIEVDEWPGWEASKLVEDERARAQKLLNELMAALRPARLHFGWRVIAEFVAFLARRAADSAEVPFESALDQITYAKVLPKLRGDDSPRCRTVLKNCQEVLESAGLEKSAEKVRELVQDLDETGSFRFWR